LPSWSINWAKKPEWRFDTRLRWQGELSYSVAACSKASTATYISIQNTQKESLICLAAVTIVEHCLENKIQDEAVKSCSSLSRRVKWPNYFGPNTLYAASP
jgi:hypothetical protein